MQSPQRVEALKRAGRPFSPPEQILALLDTGAHSTCLDRQIIARLGLAQSGVTAVHTPSTGSNYETRGTYDTTLALGDPQAQGLLVTLPVVESDFASEGFFALIGRDILRRCVFTYDGPADAFSLAF